MNHSVCDVFRVITVMANCRHGMTLSVIKSITEQRHFEMTESYK